MLPSEEFSLKFRRELRSGGILTASIAEDWGLSFSDLVFLADLPGDMQLEVALQISHLLRTGRFIEDWSDLAGDVVSYVASQIERPVAGARLALKAVVNFFSCWDFHQTALRQFAWHPLLPQYNPRLENHRQFERSSQDCFRG